eukprot:SAG22_NODE_11831_length_467_cov_1.027174_1_plen_53_part_00
MSVRFHTNNISSDDEKEPVPEVDEYGFEIGGKCMHHAGQSQCAQPTIATFVT